ncbi:MAG: insulinase family protein [Blastocatellia bacterium]|nr:insulinase family protein [Blastocatellia bacterium]MCS7157398.1 insulinase family protein [Blastocatellia bacterium]MDW8168303.1 pitrilysin family protein [Acidobacteriota bacterium]MDW8255499.1 pitrilysin family protein [Acidobacteriota bacterium]
MPIRKSFRLILVILGLAATVAAQGPKPIKVEFTDVRLENGLRVILVEDHGAPVVSLCVTYNVGSRNERPGRTGFAHLFEHMMFQGSENVGKGEHFLLIFNNGGTMNGTTNEERTNYFQTVPANQLDLVLFLEADRMRSLDVSQQNLDNQRQVVQEERRLGLDNQPYGRSREKLQELLYDNFAYKHSVIGSMEDLNAATLDDVREFFRIYYAPNNAVLTLVGAFRTQEALAKIRKYFGGIPRQPDPPPVDVTEPEQTAERRATVEDPLARLPRVDIAFKTVPGNTPDFYALQVLANVLHGGQSSRLYQKLVREKELVTSISGFMDEKRAPGGFYITATLRPGARIEEVEAVIAEEIERVRREPIADWELMKAKNTARRAFISSIASSLSRAILLGQYAVYYGDPNVINTRLERIMAVTKEDVQRVAERYLRPTNRTVVITIPKAALLPTSGQEEGGR